MERRLLVTIATQRSGTKFLGACLDAGTLVRSGGECFQPGDARGRFPAFLAGWFARHSEFDFRSQHLHAMVGDFLDHLLACSDRPVLHLDIMYNNLGAFSGAWAWPPPSGGSLLAALLRAREVPVLHLVRDSVAECHASALIAERRGWHRRTDLDGAAAGLRLVADLRRAEREMRAILAARAFVRRSFRRQGRMVELRYPDFIAGQEIAAPARTRICALLGLPEDTAAICGPSALRPTAPDKAAVIANWGDLVALEARLRAEGAAGRAP
jgi:hypothetical protein